MSTPDSEAFDKLKKCIQCIVINWKVFSWIIQDEFGGEDSFQMACALIDDLIGYLKFKWFKTNSMITKQEIIHYFQEQVEDAYDIEIDDESYDEIANEILKYYELCYTNDLKLVDEYLSSHYDDCQKKLNNLNSFSNPQVVPYEDNEELENIDEIDNYNSADEDQYEDDYED